MSTKYAAAACIGMKASGPMNGICSSSICGRMKRGMVTSFALQKKQYLDLGKEPLQLRLLHARHAEGAPSDREQLSQHVQRVTHLKKAARCEGGMVFR